MAKKSEPEFVDIRYELFDLPTAQHKAGLAGLVLAIESLKARSEKDEQAIPRKSTPEFIERPDASGAKIRFTRQSLQGLFNDLYDAALVEVAVKTKWAHKEPKRVDILDEIDPKTKKTKPTKRFIYDVVQPKETILKAWFPVMPEEKSWLKLWRDMVWQIPRATPKSREPFEQRSEGKPCKEGDIAWENLIKAKAAAETNSFATDSVAGSLWLGAQASNAEGVPFVGRVEQNLLLHFWPLTVTVSIPQRIDNDGKSEFVGFVIAIPEVAQLDRFCYKFPIICSNLDTDIHGFRPSQAIIDLPEQGALEFANSVARIKVAQEEDNPTRAVNSVEFLHLDRQGNNVKQLASGRISPDLMLLDSYSDIARPPQGAARYRNPLFKAALIQAILRGKPWWGELLALFMSRDWRFFIFASDTARVAHDVARLPWFWTDISRRFQHAERRIHAHQEALKHMSTEATDRQGAASSERLPEIIRKIVTKYVMTKAKDRSNNRLEKLNEVKAGLAQSLFLEFRSRKDQAFVDHFAATFFAVGQWFNNEDQDFQVLSSCLLDRSADGRADLKTLTLAALSAVSWVPQEKSAKGEEE